MIKTLWCTVFFREVSEGFGLALNLEWMPGELSAEERTTAALLRAKYTGAESPGAP